MLSAVPILMLVVVVTIEALLLMFDRGPSERFDVAVAEAVVMEVVVVVVVVLVGGVVVVLLSCAWLWLSVDEEGAAKNVPYKKAGLSNLAAATRASFRNTGRQLDPDIVHRYPEDRKNTPSKKK